MDPEQARASFPLPALTDAGVAWLLCGFTLASIAFAVALSVPNRFDPWELIFLADVAAAALVGGLISSRRPANLVGWFVAGHALCFALAEFTRQYAIYGVLTEPGALPAARAFASPSYWLWFPGLILLFSLLPLYFPDGRLLSPRWRPVVWLAVFAAAATAGVAAIQPGDWETPGIPNPLGIEDLPSFALAGPLLAAAWLGVGLASTASLVVRFRRSRSEERQQIKWFAYAMVLGISFEIVNKLFALWVLAPAVYSFLTTIVGMSLWTAVAVAILKHRLFDIDLIINRTLVYGALTAVVVGVYILAVGYLGAVFQTSGNLAVSLVATGIVAVIFQPLRDRLQRGANRLMYGERDDPYGVISRLGRRLEGTLAPEAVLPAIVDDVSKALRLPQADIWLADGDTLRLGASHGEAPTQTTVRDADAIMKLRHAPDGLRPTDLDLSGEYGTLLAKSGAALVLPLTHRGDLVGALSLAPRGPGEEFSPADRRLLRDLATQAGAAAHAVRLTVALRSSLEDLRQSRERLVAAQEEERRRIQRDLHDGLGPVLASMRLRLEACLDAAQETKDSTSEAPLADDLERLYELVGQATGDIRRLVYDLRPPVLDQLGLVPALRQHCERFRRETGIAVGFKAEAGLPVPAAAEAAILRFAQEALLNVEKHARASRVDARLERSDGSITLTIRDDGAGMDEARNGRTGTGVGSMRERADLLGGTLFIGGGPGGGMEVSMRIPVGAPDREGVK